MLREQLLMVLITSLLAWFLDHVSYKPHKLLKQQEAERNYKMQVILDNRPYNVQEAVEDKLLAEMSNRALQVYNELPGSIQSLIAMFARKKLADMESDAIASGVSKEQAKTLRPPKGTDYGVH